MIFTPVFRSNGLTSEFPLLEWRLASYGAYISQLVKFARCCITVLNYYSKNLQITSKLLTQDYRYHNLWKTFGKFFRSYPELLCKFGDISFQEYVSEGISHLVLNGDLVYILSRVKCEANSVSSGSKIVKRRRRRKYDPLIIERTIFMMLGPSTTLCRYNLKHCSLTYKAFWDCMTKLVQASSVATMPDLASRRAEQSLLLWMLFLSSYMFVK